MIYRSIVKGFIGIILLIVLSNGFALAQQKVYNQTTSKKQGHTVNVNSQPPVKKVKHNHIKLHTHSLGTQRVHNHDQLYEIKTSKKKPNTGGSVSRKGEVPGSYAWVNMYNPDESRKTPHIKADHIKYKHKAVNLHLKAINETIKVRSRNDFKEKARDKNHRARKSKPVWKRSDAYAKFNVLSSQSLHQDGRTSPNYVNKSPSKKKLKEANNDMGVRVRLDVKVNKNSALSRSALRHGKMSVSMKGENAGSINRDLVLRNSPYDDNPSYEGGMERKNKNKIEVGNKRSASHSKASGSNAYQFQEPHHTVETYTDATGHIPALDKKQKTSYLQSKGNMAGLYIGEMQRSKSRIIKPGNKNSSKQSKLSGSNAYQFQEPHHTIETYTDVTGHIPARDEKENKAYLQSQGTQSGLFSGQIKMSKGQAPVTGNRKSVRHSNLSGSNAYQFQEPHHTIETYTDVTGHIPARDEKENKAYLQNQGNTSGLFSGQIKLNKSEAPIEANKKSVKQSRLSGSNAYQFQEPHHTIETYTDVTGHIPARDEKENKAYLQNQGNTSGLFSGQIKLNKSEAPADANKKSVKQSRLSGSNAYQFQEPHHTIETYTDVTGHIPALDEKQNKEHLQSKGNMVGLHGGSLKLNTAKMVIYRKPKQMTASRKGESTMSMNRDLVLRNRPYNTDPKFEGNVERKKREAPHVANKYSKKESQHTGTIAYKFTEPRHTTETYTDVTGHISVLDEKQSKEALKAHSNQAGFSTGFRKVDKKKFYGTDKEKLIKQEQKSGRGGVTIAMTSVSLKEKKAALNSASSQSSSYRGTFSKRAKGKKDFHPSSEYLAVDYSKNNEKKERLRKKRLKKAQKDKNIDQPKYVLERQSKPKYDPKESDLWND